MPTYDYQCDGCGHRWEMFQSIKDEAVKVCPDCNEEKARRLIGSGAAILFKGSGFYTTDYRSESYKKDASADKPSPAKSDNGNKKSSSDKKSDG